MSKIALKNVVVTEPRAIEFITECNRVIVGHTEELAMIYAGVLGNGIISLVTDPGEGKTLLAKVIPAAIADCKVGRLQMTPDMKPSDITGYIDTTPTGREFVPGPLQGKNWFVGDEINRGSAKTQSGLLEAFEERHITVAGETYPLEEFFVGITTRNDIESEGTYPMSDALKNRILGEFTWAGCKDEELTAIHSRKLLYKRDPEKFIKPVTTNPELLALQEKVLEIVDNGVSDAVADYITQLVQASNPKREQFKKLPEYKPEDGKGKSWDKLVAKGSSPRTALGTRKLAAAIAYICGSEQVTVDHVQVAFPAVARAHVGMSPFAKQGRFQVTVGDFIDAVLKNTTAP